MAGCVAVWGGGRSEAPYNPAQGAELATLWQDAHVRAVIAAPEDHATQAIASRLGLPLWPLSADASGRVDLAIAKGGRDLLELPDAHDVALLLHTRGTTTKPKG